MKFSAVSGPTTGASVPRERLWRVVSGSLLAISTLCLAWVVVASLGNG